jgi:hypothetical protein
VSDDLVLIIKSKGEGSSWHMAGHINTNERFNTTLTSFCLAPLAEEAKRFVE